MDDSLYSSTPMLYNVLKTTLKENFAMNGEFIGGFIAGVGLMVLITIITLVVRNCNENSGYKDKMIIEYHCPGKEYERKLIRDLVNASGIQTNFVNKECTMDKWGVKYRLTNPDNYKNDD